MHTHTHAHTRARMHTHTMAAPGETEHKGRSLAHSQTLLNVTTTPPIPQGTMETDHTSHQFIYITRKAGTERTER